MRGFRGQRAKGLGIYIPRLSKVFWIRIQCNLKCGPSRKDASGPKFSDFDVIVKIVALFEECSITANGKGQNKQAK